MQYLESALASIQSIEISNITFLKDMALICVIILLLSFLGRMLCGKRSGLNHAVSSAIGILAVYMLGIFLYKSSTILSGLIASLPFVAVRGQTLALFSFQAASRADLCSMLVRMILLAFFVNLLDTLFPKGTHFFTWLLFRLLTIFLAVLFQGVIVWASETYLPEAFLSWAPAILLGILAAMLLLGALKLLVGIALATVNPIIGALYTLFFSTLVGKQLSKAILTTLLLCILVYALDAMGYAVISLSAISAAVFFPILLALLLLWYLANRIL